jgi:ribosome-associated toxin RatA of RatAB toxin-antitoxin module
VGDNPRVTDQASQRTIIAAAPEVVFAAAVDFERYPEWARDIKTATVETRDDQGRGVEVTFRAAAMGRSTSYTLRYDYGAAPGRLGWVLARGDIMRRLDGAYTFVALADDPESTEVVYGLTVDLVVPLPGFVKRRAEARIMHTALRELKSRVESAPAP